MTANRLSTGLAFLLAVFADFAAASGSALPRPNAEDLSMADATVALASGPGAQIVNPANIDDVTSDDAWVLSTALGHVSAEYQRYVAATGASAGEFSAETGYPIIPLAALTHRLGDRVSVGVSVDSPYGMRSEWGEGAWQAIVGPYAIDLATSAELRVVRLGTTAAWSPSREWSFGARIFGQFVSAHEENDLYRVEGDGVSAGYQLGMRHRGDHFVFGASYTSRTNTELDGTLSRIHPVATTLVAGDAKTDILLPDRLQIGTAFRLTQNLWAETDLDWFGWSYVDELTIYQADGTVANAGRNQRNSKDTVSIRAGLKWQYRPGLTLRAGVGYDPSPIPDEDASPTASMLRKTRAAVGATYSLSPALDLGVAYQYIHGHARYVNETVQDDLAGSDTAVFEGSYNSRSHALAVTLAGRF